MFILQMTFVHSNAPIERSPKAINSPGEKNEEALWDCKEVKIFEHFIHLDAGGE